MKRKRFKEGKAERGESKGRGEEEVRESEKSKRRRKNCCEKLRATSDVFHRKQSETFARKEDKQQQNALREISGQASSSNISSKNCLNMKS